MSTFSKESVHLICHVKYDGHRTILWLNFLSTAALLTQTMLLSIEQHEYGYKPKADMNLNLYRIDSNSKVINFRRSIGDNHNRLVLFE